MNATQNTQDTAAERTDLIDLAESLSDGDYTEYTVEELETYASRCEELAINEAASLFWNYADNQLMEEDTF